MKGFIKLLLVLFVTQGCSGQTAEKINGISFVASPQKATAAQVVPVQQLGANYAAIMPFGFIRSVETPEVIYNTERQWFGERLEGAKQYIELLQSKDIRVMLKPQLWIWRGEYTGYLQMENEEKWQQLEASYRSFILDYATLAQDTEVAMFCIGTELEQFVKQRPDFWDTLITEVKQRYKGKLTYAANWDEYKRVPFWEALDYIGVDGYFPVSDTETPTVAAAQNGWQRWKTELAEIATTQQKQILFTEWGYRSVNYAGKEPWVSDRSLVGVNLEAQTNTTEAVFKELYKESWFAGGFVWKWFIDYENSGGKENNRFTPQNKPAEAILKKYYAQY